MDFYGQYISFMAVFTGKGWYLQEWSKGLGVVGD